LRASCLETSAALDEDSCPGRYAWLVHPAEAENQAAKNPLERLEHYLLREQPEENLKAGPDFYLKHDLRIKNGKGYLAIGYLRRKDQKFRKLLALAIRDGSLAEVNAGVILGPKALTFLNRIRASRPAGAPPLVIRGRMEPSRLKKYFEQRVLRQSERDDDPEHWTFSEAQDFEQAWKELGIDEGCRKIWKNKSCGAVSFEITVPEPGQISWGKSLLGRFQGKILDKVERDQ
jgi:hypothetical protein